MSLEATIERAHQELKQGRAWRAKEILASSLAQYNYSRQVCLAYANVLLNMNDDLEAGRFFLLSVDEPEKTQLAAMNFFLERFQSDSFEQLISRFPRKAIPKDLDSVPLYLQQHLRKAGAPDCLERSSNVKTSHTNWDRFFGGIFVFAVLFFLFCAILGCLQVCRFIANLVT